MCPRDVDGAPFPAMVWARVHDWKVLSRARCEDAEWRVRTESWLGMGKGGGGYVKHRDGSGGTWLDGDEEEAAEVGWREGRFL